jgi:hypothetical protein
MQSLRKHMYSSIDGRENIEYFRVCNLKYHPIYTFIPLQQHRFCAFVLQGVATPKLSRDIYYTFDRYYYFNSPGSLALSEHSRALSVRTRPFDLEGPKLRTSLCHSASHNVSKYPQTAQPKSRFPKALFQGNQL